MAVQMANNTGAEVYTTVSSPEKADFAKSLGADHCLNYIEENFVEAVLRLTDGAGVDLVFDTVGKETFPASFGATKIYGHVVTLSEDLCDQAAIKLAKLRNLTVSYELMLSPMHFKLHQARVKQRGMLNEATRLIDAGKIKVVVKHVFELADIGQAHQVIEAGHSTGKTVIKIV